MSGDDANLLTCQEVTERLERAFDDGADVAVDRDTAAHLAACRACREIHETLSRATMVMAELPTIPFPDDALATVWSRTVDRERPEAPAVRWYAGAKRLAIAASLVLAVSVSWLALNEATARRDRRERAVAEARYVLAVTVGAVQRVEAVAVEDVLETHLGGALKNLTNQWTQLSEPLLRRLGT